MRRRSRAGGKPIKARRRKAATLNRPNAPKVRGRRKPSGARTSANTKNALLKRERDEALERENASAEVLRVISASPGELEPVFQAMLKNAARLCEATIATLWLYEQGGFRAAAVHGGTKEWAAERMRGSLLRPGPGTGLARVAKTKRVVHIKDMKAEKAYRDDEPVFVEDVDLAGIRTLLSVPMIKDNQLIGTIGLSRREVRPFTDKQIALVQNFAAQAVIAIENTRLLSELRELLQQQTATADVLKVISRSTFDLRTVLDTLVESAARLCDAERANIWRPSGEVYKIAAAYALSPQHTEILEKLFIVPGRKTCVGRALLEHKTVQILDTQSDLEYANPAIDIGVTRTMLGVPLLREGTPIGVLVVTRSIVQPFTDQQVALLETFADQAVIAIENARLFEAEQQRTRELSELLEQQTATSEVLKVISSSPGELEPVFQAMLENATRICEAKFGTLLRFDGKAFQFAAEVGTPRELVEFSKRRGPFEPVPGSQLDHLMRTKLVSHTADYAAEAVVSPVVKLGGARSTVDVPMLKDDELVGAFSIYRQEVRPFTDKQIELLKNFAAQAVIAIENTRLLNELRQSLEQQTATADVLRVISSSPGELEPVFQAMLQKAVHVCDAKFGNIYRWDGDSLHLLATHNTPRAFAASRRNLPFRPGPHTPTGPWWRPNW